MAMIDVSDNIHKMIVKKQAELYEIDGKKTKLSEIADRAIINGINSI